MSVLRDSGQRPDATSATGRRYKISLLNGAWDFSISVFYKYASPDGLWKFVFIRVIRG
jgi:hypothetical protein